MHRERTAGWVPAHDAEMGWFGGASTFHVFFLFPCVLCVSVSVLYVLSLTNPSNGLIN